MAALLAFNLEAEGYVVERVERGDEVGIVWPKGCPDLVLLDWTLPGLSGLEICRRLRARDRTRKLPVIMVTGRARRRSACAACRSERTITWSSRFRWRSSWRGCAPFFGAPGRRGSRLASVCGEVVLDRETARVRRGERDVRLGPTEYRLLEILLEAPGRVFTRSS